MSASVGRAPSSASRVRCSSSSAPMRPTPSAISFGRCRERSPSHERALGDLVLRPAEGVRLLGEHLDQHLQGRRAQASHAVRLGVRPNPRGGNAVVVGTQGLGGGHPVSQRGAGETRHRSVGRASRRMSGPTAATGSALVEMRAATVSCSACRMRLCDRAVTAARSAARIRPRVTPVQRLGDIAAECRRRQGRVRRHYPLDLRPGRGHQLVLVYLHHTGAEAGDDPVGRVEVEVTQPLRSLGLGGHGAARHVERRRRGAGRASGLLRRPA
jgi:hypothetical protein